MQILNIPNGCFADQDLSYLLSASCELLLASYGQKAASKTLRVLVRRLLELLFTYSGRGTYSRATPRLLNASVTGGGDFASNQERDQDRGVRAGPAGPAAAEPILWWKNYYDFTITASTRSSSSLKQSRIDNYRTALRVTPTCSSLPSFPVKFHPVKTYAFPKRKFGLKGEQQSCSHGSTSTTCIETELLTLQSCWNRDGPGRPTFATDL